VLDVSSTYSFEDSTDFAAASADKVGSGYVYTRWANPTVDAFEEAVADLEGAEAAEAFSSGMAAISTIFLALCSAGDQLVAARQLYGGTHSLLTHLLPRYGIDARLVEVNDYDAIAKGLADSARLLYCETIGNPRVVAADVPRLADLATDAGVPLVVDNTFASPALFRPLEHGAAVVVHSATKFLGGHHDLLGGVVCSSSELIEPVRAVARELGPTMAPFNAWLALRGLATLALRVHQSSDSAREIAEWLAARPDLEAVYYPGLPSDPGHSLAQELFGGRAGGTVGFDVAGGRERARTFQDHLQLIGRAASLGGTHSLIVHAASVTHTQLGPDELHAAGISEGFCRLSVGLEDPKDLIDDLATALDG
jgi:cystathionine beta-lyase/cystathionine gamma-synthase